MQRLAIAAGISLVACAAERNVMTDTKQIVRRLFEDGFNQGRNETIDQVIAPDYVSETGERGPGAFKDVIVRLRSAFPDIHYTLDDVISEGDRVAVRFRWTGTHRGSFRGIAPTEKPLTSTGAAIFRLRGEQIVGAALETDRLGFLQGLGVVPANEVLFAPR